MGKNFIYMNGCVGSDLLSEISETRTVSSLSVDVDELLCRGRLILRALDVLRSNRISFEEETLYVVILDVLPKPFEPLSVVDVVSVKINCGTFMRSNISCAIFDFL